MCRGQGGVLAGVVSRLRPEVIRRSGDPSRRITPILIAGHMPRKDPGLDPASNYIVYPPFSLLF